MKKGVPTGIIVISVLLFLSALESIVLGIFMFGFNFFEGGTISTLLSDFELLSTAIFPILFGIIFIIIGIGLLKQKKWARISAIIISILGILGGLIVLILFPARLNIPLITFLLSPIAWEFYLGIIVFIIVLIYLIMNKKVKKIYS
jgi:hypothetical protein